MSPKLSTTREQQQHSDSEMPTQSWTHRDPCFFIPIPPLQHRLWLDFQNYFYFFQVLHGIFSLELVELLLSTPWSLQLMHKHKMGSPFVLVGSPCNPWLLSLVFPLFLKKKQSISISDFFFSFFCTQFITALISSNSGKVLFSTVLFKRNTQWYTQILHNAATAVAVLQEMRKKLSNEAALRKT